MGLIEPLCPHCGAEIIKEFWNQPNSYINYEVHYTCGYKLIIECRTITIHCPVHEKKEEVWNNII